MTYTVIDVSSGERLKASVLTQLQTNISDVRKNHIGSDAPNVLELGTIFVKNNVSPWEVYQYDGTENVHLFDIDTSGNRPKALGYLLGTSEIPDYSISSSLLSSGCVVYGKIASGQVIASHLNDNIFNSNQYITPAARNILVLSSYHIASYTLVSTKFNISNGTISGYGTNINVTLPNYTGGMPLVSYAYVGTPGDPRFLQRAGTASATTPGFTFSLPSASSYYVYYWGFS